MKTSVRLSAGVCAPSQDELMQPSNSPTALCQYLKSLFECVCVGGDYLQFKFRLLLPVSADRGISEAEVTCQRGGATRGQRRPVGGQFPSHSAAERPGGSCGFPVTLTVT